MYPSSVVSNVKARRKNTHHDLLQKNIYILKRKDCFHCLFIRLLFGPCVLRLHLSPPEGYGCIHFSNSIFTLKKRKEKEEIKFKK